MSTALWFGHLEGPQNFSCKYETVEIFVINSPKSKFEIRTVLGCRQRRCYTKICLILRLKLDFKMIHSFSQLFIKDKNWTPSIINGG